MRILSFTLATTALTAALSAQTAVVHANGNNFLYDNGSSMGGPNLLLGMRTTVPTTMVVTRLEVWTGEGIGTNSLALWTHDAVNNRPGTSLGGSTWSMGLTNGWQGVNLATPLVLLPNDTVWVVWGPINGAQSSTIGAGAGPVYRGSFDGGTTWNGPFSSQQWKFRLWTGTPGHYEVYGTGCLGSRGRPGLAWFGMPMAGGQFQVTLDRGPLGSFAMLAFGDSDSQSNGTPLPYSLTPLGAPNCSVLASPLVTLLYGTDPASGQSVATVTLPADPGLLGFSFYDQWFCFDPAANALGLSVSNGGRGIVGM